MVGFIKSIINLGAPVLMPIIFFILAIVFGEKIGKAFKASMLVGIGFVGVSMVIGILLDNIGAASEAMVSRTGLKLSVVDVGWGTAATIGWGSPIMPVIVIGFLIINIILLILNITKTVNIDIFNYWLFLLVGAVVYAATNNYWISVVITFILFGLSLIAADKTAPRIQEQYNLRGISFPHLTCLSWIPIGIAVNWIIEKIPGLRDIDFNPEKISDKYGVLGESITLGFILGAIIGLLAGYSIGELVLLGVNVAAAMYLMPKMIGVLVEGLTIIQSAAEKRLKQWFPKREFYIGMDTALLIGEPSVLASGLLLIPISLLLAFILPGNKVMPLVDLASLMFLLAMVTPYVKRNLFRMVITGSVIIIIILYVGTNISSIYTLAAKMSNVESAEGISAMTNMVGTAANWVGWIAIKIGEILNNIFF